jgi:hypothetical protein
MTGSNPWGPVGRLLLFAALLTALAATVAGCGGDEDDPGNAATEVPTTSRTTPTKTPAEQAWERVVPGGDCRCAGGSELHPASPGEAIRFTILSWAWRTSSPRLQDGGGARVSLDRRRD